MSEPLLSDRQDAILRAVCREYVVTGQAVSSRALVRSHGFRWSSATLRSELATLEKMGLLQRPHRSAGCSPTRLGLERYVAGLSAASAPPAAMLHAVDRSLRKVRDDPARGMRTAACVLSEVAGCLAVAFLGSSAGGRIEQVDVVPLVGGRALVVLAMEGGATRMQPVDVDDAREPERAPSVFGHLQSRLRELCRGRTLAEAREALLARLGEREAHIDRLLAHALRVGLQVCTADAMDPLWIEVAGQPVLARQVGDAGRLGHVLALLEDDQRLAQVLCQLLPAPQAGGPVRAEVHVGASALLMRDNADASGLALVGCRVPVERRDGAVERGAVVLLGPDRMDYGVVIPLVEYAARALAARVGA